MDSASRHDPLSITGIQKHILADGCTFDIKTRTASAQLDRPSLRIACDDNE